MEKTWTCTRCTFQNSPLNIRCVMCETRKATNPETGEWKCLKCTFSFNPPWIKVCDTCGTPREDLAACKQFFSTLIRSPNTITQFSSKLQSIVL